LFEWQDKATKFIELTLYYERKTVDDKVGAIQMLGKHGSERLGTEGGGVIHWIFIAHLIHFMIGTSFYVSDLTVAEKGFRKTA